MSLVPGARLGPSERSDMNCGTIECATPYTRYGNLLVGSEMLIASPGNLGEIARCKEVILLACFGLGHRELVEGLEDCRLGFSLITNNINRHYPRLD